MANETVRFDKVDATVIGFLADTHVQQADGSDLPQEVFDAFAERGTQLIVHIGHYGNPGLLSRLAETAAVMATNTALDAKNVAELDGADAARVAGIARVIEAGGLRIGVTFDLSGNGFNTKASDPPIVLNGRSMAEVMTEKFGAPVDVVAYANTHVDRVSSCEGVLLVNPGSPNLPGADRKGGLGTVAVLRIEAGIAEVEIVDMERVRRMKAEAVHG